MLSNVEASSQSNAAGSICNKAVNSRLRYKKHLNSQGALLSERIRYACGSPGRFKDREWRHAVLAVYLQILHNSRCVVIITYYARPEVRASQLAQASERVGSLIPASQQG